MQEPWCWRRRCVDADALPALLAPRLQHPEPPLCMASASCALSPLSPGGARPSAAPPPALLPHRRAWAGVPKVCEEGSRVAQRDPRATLTRGSGEGGGGEAGWDRM